MKCLYPKECTGGMRPCGSCVPCRINRQRGWIARMQLEEFEHQASSFVTLTYDEEHVPLVYDPDSGEWLPTLRREDVQKWLKRLRKKVHGYALPAVRYFLTGEYGSRTQRPHYHAIIFGLECTAGDLIQTTWKNGWIDIKPTNAKNIAYTAKYTLKGLRKDDRDLRSRQPTFILTSRRPGIGALSIPKIGASLVTRRNGQLISKGTIDGTVRISGRVYQLDRFMWTKLKSWMNLPKHIEPSILLRNSGIYDSVYGKAKAEKAERQAQRTTSAEVL